MMGEVIAGILAGITFTIGIYLGSDTAYTTAMQEALDRGYAVQCVGKTGIYWECEE